MDTHRTGEHVAHEPTLVALELAVVTEFPIVALVVSEVRTSVATPMRFAASADEVWSRLMFYEQIDGRPPLHLRVLLPVPIRTVGDKSHVGDEARCLYEGGYLVKRVTRVEPARLYAFDVIEQALEIGGGMTLAGGRYTLDRRGPRTTVVTLETRYTSTRRPRWLWRPIEAAVCHAFHRHILRSMRRGVETH